jgi:hypothetical protein
MRKFKPGQTFEQARRQETSRRMSILTERLKPPTPTAVAVEDPTVFDMEEYRKLVAELEVDDTAIRNYELRQFFASEGIQVYDYAKVVSFMDAKTQEEAKKHGTQNLAWRWKPLNEKYPDAPKTPGSQWSTQLLSAEIDIWPRTVMVGSMRAEPLPGGTMMLSSTKPSRAYARPIPHAVLLTVKKIRDRFKDAVAFYATDYEVKDPDPFLMVTGERLDYYVVERWNEPSFRG